MVTSKSSRRSISSDVATIAVGAATALAPVSATGSTRSPPLLRKSSSTGLLDGVGTPPDVDKTAAKGDVVPKLRRRSGNLQGRNKKAEPRRHSEKLKIKKSARKEDRRASGCDMSKSAGTPLPQLSSSSMKSRSSVSLQSISGYPKRSKRAGDIELMRDATISVVMKYQLGQYELKKFKQCFQQIDLDSSGMIDYDEFFEFIDETKTPFSEGLFRMIDADNNGMIDYEEFVHAMVLYCMYTRDEILQFAFDTFDTAKTGAIGEKEFKRLVSVVNDGKPVYPGNFKNALNDFDRNKDGLLDFEEFKIMNKRYPMLLFPCFRLQDRMQKSTLGESHWLQLHKRLYQKLKLENYQRKHNGELPALSLVGTIRKFFHLDTMDVYQP